MNTLPTGPSAFGPAYRHMLDHDCHAPGSVDQVLTSSLVRLGAATAEHLYSRFTPRDVGYRAGSRPGLETVVRQLHADDSGQFVSRLADFGRGLGRRATQDLDRMVFGGTEEEIIARGSDWCADVARVVCALAQIGGLPARLVNLFDLEQAYSGHVIVELHRQGCWGAIDPINTVVYQHPNGAPATTWELMCSAELVVAHGQSAGQFRAAGIANYPCWQADRFDYTTSRIDALDQGRR